MEDPLAALMSSSARHSAMVLMFLKAASRAPVVSRKIAWFTRLRGEISTACLLTTPADPILVASSRGPLSHPINKDNEKIVHTTKYQVSVTYLLTMASMITWIGLASVKRWIISMACLMILTAINFLPLFLPCIMREFVSLSTIGHWAFLNLLTEYLPAVWGTKVACFAGWTPM